MKRFENEPFVIVGVNTDDDPDEYREKLEEFGVTWINAWQGMPICTRFGVQGFPTMAVLDETGRVAVMDPRGEELEKAVQRVLDAKKAREEAGQGL